MVKVQPNSALTDEIEAINSIYGEGTIQLNQEDNNQIIGHETILQLPDNLFSFKIAFESNYPELPPTVKGIHSIARSGLAKGDGRRAEELLSQVLRRVFVAGQVCLFDLIEEVSETLRRSYHQEESDDDETLPARKGNPNSTACPSSTPEGAFSRNPQPDLNGDPNKMYAALIRTHHITSRKKVSTLKAMAKEIGCAALLRSGGTPGLMYVESPQESHVQKWVGVVHGLRYKDYQLILPAAIVPERGRVMETGYRFEEVDTIKEFGAKMQEKGIFEWWRKAMGYVAA